MIDLVSLGVFVVLAVVAYCLVRLLEPVTAWLDGVQTHRSAQAASVLHHAGLLDASATEDDA